MDFIQLNGYDVKDQIARSSVERIDKTLENVATKDDITVINNKINNLNFEEITNIEVTVNKIVNEDLTNINQQINNIINSLNDYATQEDINNIQLQINSQLASIHTHDNLAALNMITIEKVQGWDNRSDFSGSYNDLSDKPKLFSGNYNDLTNKPSFAKVATSGDYNDLTNKPELGKPSDEVMEEVSKDIEDTTNDVLNAIANIITVIYENIDSPGDTPLPANVATMEYVDQQIALFYARLLELIQNQDKTEVPTKLSQLEIDCCATDDDIRVLKNLFLVE